MSQENFYLEETTKNQNPPQVSSTRSGITFSLSRNIKPINKFQLKKFMGAKEK